MKIKIEKNPYLVIGVIIFFILLLDYLILLRPQLALLKQTSSQAGSLSRNLKATKKDIASIEQFRQRLSTLQEKIAVVGERIAQEEEMPVVLENISKLAKQSNLKIIQLKPFREEEKIVATSQAGNIYELPVLIEARCGYHQLGFFVNKLENGRIFMDLAGMELLPNAEDSLHHHAKLVVNTYILKKK